VATHRLFNPGDAPVVYDTEGHQVPAGGWCDSEPKDPVTADLLGSGLLLDQGTTAKAEKEG
jgi:hypothetical protein